MSKSKSEKKTVKKEKASKANYGANENLRVCRNCNSTNSTTSKTRNSGRIIFRYRICSDCGAKRTTREIVEQPASE